MFPYTVKYTESDSDIQNNNSLYKIDQTCQNTFDFILFFENVGKFRKRQKTYFYLLHVYCP